MTTLNNTQTNVIKYWTTIAITYHACTQFCIWLEIWNFFRQKKNFVTYSQSNTKLSACMVSNCSSCSIFYYICLCIIKCSQVLFISILWVWCFMFGRIYIHACMTVILITPNENRFRKSIQYLWCWWRWFLFGSLYMLAWHLLFWFYM